MKSIQNKGINLTAEDLKNRIADRKERYTKQQARREKLEQTMENTRNDIEQLEYTLAWRLTTESGWYSSPVIGEGNR